MNVILENGKNFIQNKKIITDLDNIFDSGQNVILIGEKGSGTSSTSLFYASHNNIFDQVFLIESESREKIDFELNSFIDKTNFIKPIRLEEKIENSLKNDKILIILDQVEKFNDVEDIYKKFQNKANFFITTHNYLGQYKNFVELKQPQIDFQKAVNFLSRETQGAFQIKQIKNLVRFLMKGNKFILPYFLSKIAQIIKFNSIYYTKEDILTQVYAYTKSPADFFLDNIFEKPIFDILATMLFFDHKFINTSLIEFFFSQKGNRNREIRANLKKLTKLALINTKSKNGVDGIEIHDLVFHSTLRYINKEQQYLKKFANLYKEVLNFYFTYFGDQFQDGIKFYNHAKKILSFEFNFLNSIFDQSQMKKVNRIKSKLFYSMALFRFSHLIDYTECINLCLRGKINSENQSEFDDLINKCNELNLNFDLESRSDHSLDDLKVSHFDDKLPVLMDHNDTLNWLKEKKISRIIIEYLVPIDGLQLMDYFVLLTKDSLFFEIVFMQEIPNATKDEIIYFSKCLKELYIHPLENPELFQ